MKSINITTLKYFSDIEQTTRRVGSSVLDPFLASVQQGFRRRCRHSQSCQVPERIGARRLLSRPRPSISNRRCLSLDRPSSPLFRQMGPIFIFIFHRLLYSIVCILYRSHNCQPGRQNAAIHWAKAITLDNSAAWGKAAKRVAVHELYCQIKILIYDLSPGNELCIQ